VQTAHDGAEALEVAQDRPPDLMLLDLMMPGPFDGIEVCRRLRDAEATRSVPIVIVTAVAEEATRQQALAAGADAYFTKPFSPMALLALIDDLGRRPD